MRGWNCLKALRADISLLVGPDTQWLGSPVFLKPVHAPDEFTSARVIEEGAQVADDARIGAFAGRRRAR